MEEKELLEIAARKTEQAKRNIEEMIRRRKISDISLLYKDKFDLGGRKVCCPAVMEIRPQFLIPVFEKVLLPINAFPSPEKFKEACGFTVDQVVEWRKRGWVETMILMGPEDYSNLDYLDMLLQVSPWHSVRDLWYFTELLGGRNALNEIYSEGEGIFKEIKPRDDTQRLFGQDKAKEIDIGNSATNYTKLHAFGLNHMLKELVQSTKLSLDAKAKVLSVFDTFLDSPFSLGLRNTTAYLSESRDIASRIYDVVQPKNDLFFAPCWLADVYDNLGVDVPDNIDADQIQAVRKHSEEFLRAVKILDDEIDRIVREKSKGGELNRGEKETIIANREEFRKRWFEDVVPAFADLSQRDKLWSMMMTGSIVAPAVALPAFIGILGIPPAFTALAASDKIEKLVDPAAEFLSTFFECNPIHLGFYKVHRELKKAKRASG